MSKCHHTFSEDNFLHNILALRIVVTKLLDQRDQLKGDFEHLDEEIKADFEQLKKLICTLSQAIKRTST